MEQISPQYCPQCGTEIVPQQKFCSTCGLPRALQDVGQAAPSLPSAPVLAGGPQPSIAQPQVQHPPMSYPASPFPSSSTPPSQKRKLGRNGMILLLIALLLVIAAAGYGILHALGVGKPTQAPISRTEINATVTYASVEITVLNAQQSENFLDDPVSTSNGMLRVQVRAKNTFTQPVTLAYSNIAHLVQSNGKEGPVLYASSSPTIMPGVTQASSIDFALPTAIKMDQLTLRLGAANEAQLDIPLDGHADVSKYMPKTIQLAKNLTYLNTDWTLVSATSQLSLDGRQASKGMRYVTLALSVDNPLMQTVIPGSPYTYMRLKTNDVEVGPTSATVPISLDPGVNGKTGTATFQMPQTGSNLTLTLTAPDNSGFDSATTTFQI